MKKLLKRKRIAGFSLIESLVYIAIFLLLSGAALGLLFSLNDLFVQYKLKQSLLTSGTSIMERLLLEIREADSVVIADSVFASSTAGVLSLSSDGQIIRFEKNDTDLELYIEDVLDNVLQNSAVEVVGSTFYYYEMNEVELVRVHLTLSSTIGTQSEDWMITGGAIVRGSYDNTP